MNEKVLTIDELAKALQVSKRTISNSLKRPDCKIPYSIIGKSKRFLLSDVLRATGNKENKA